jgi:hypothetical protein
MGYRGYPKYGIVNRYFLYRQALLEEAGRLVRADVLHGREASITSRSRSCASPGSMLGAQVNQSDPAVASLRKVA